MQIKSVRPSRQPNTIWLTFVGGSFLPLSVDDIYRLKLRVGDVLDADNYQRICNLSLHHLLLNYALNQVAISPKVESVLRPKLRLKLMQVQKKYHITTPPSELVDQIIDQLNSQNLLDETSFVESLCRRYSHKSIGYVKKLLLSKKINPSNYTHLLDTGSENLKIIRLLSKFKLSLQNRPQVISKLIYRGFSYDSIKTAIDEYLGNL